MQRFSNVMNVLGPIVVIGAIAAFIAYSLAFYSPGDRLACNTNVVARQADVAVHVIRQWAGRESQEYAGCSK